MSHIVLVMQMSLILTSKLYCSCVQTNTVLVYIHPFGLYISKLSFTSTERDRFSISGSVNIMFARTYLNIHKSNAVGLYWNFLKDSLSSSEFI